MTYGRQFQRSFDKKGSKSVLLCTTLAFIKFIVHSLAHQMTTTKSKDKIVKLLDLLDKHINEENCRHGPEELLKEYENLTSI